MTPLRRRMIEDMKLKNLSARTIEAYTSRVGTFAGWPGRGPRRGRGASDTRSRIAPRLRGTPGTHRRPLLLRLPDPVPVSGSLRRHVLDPYRIGLLR
jgi:hypothetical protein